MSQINHRVDLRLGRWQDVLADVVEVDSVITDPPYSPRTHAGYRSATDYAPVPRSGPGATDRDMHRESRGMPKERDELPYAPLDRSQVVDVVSKFKPRKWWVVFGDHESSRWWSDALGEAGYLVFAPVVWVRKGSAPRFFADGPANSCEWITVARPRTLPATRFSRPGHYIGSMQCEKVVVGGKPPWLMQELVRHYSDPGDLICDPFAGGASTLIAASLEGRFAVGAEMDPDTYAKAVRRIARGCLPTFDVSAG